MLGYLLVDTSKMATTETNTERSLIAHWLKENRLKRGLTQEEVASAADVDTTYISKIELGKKSPSRKVVEKFALALASSEADEDSYRSLLNAGLKAAGFAPTSEIEYETDPDIQMIVEAYSGGTDRGKRAIKSAAELALEMSRENSIGKRAK